MKNPKPHEGKITRAVILSITACDKELSVVLKKQHAGLRDPYQPLFPVDFISPSHCLMQRLLPPIKSYFVDTT